MVVVVGGGVVVGCGLVCFVVVVVGGVGERIHIRTITILTSSITITINRTKISIRSQPHLHILQRWTTSLISTWVISIRICIIISIITINITGISIVVIIISGWWVKIWVVIVICIGIGIGIGVRVRVRVRVRCIDGCIFLFLVGLVCWGIFCGCCGVV